MAGFEPHLTIPSRVARHARHATLHGIALAIALLTTGCASTFSGMTTAQIGELKGMYQGKVFWTKGALPKAPDSEQIGVGRHVKVTVSEVVTSFTTFLRVTADDSSTGTVTLLNHDQGYDLRAVELVVDAALYRRDPSAVRADLARQADARQLTLADHAEIEVGMATDLVLWAYGNPDARKEIADESGRVEVWGYSQLSAPRGTVTFRDGKVIRFNTLK